MIDREIQQRPEYIFDLTDVPPIKLKLGNVLFEMWPENYRCRTTFPDGASLTAAPTGLHRDGQVSEEYASQAWRLGYISSTWDEATRNSWRMCVEHEALHTWLAQREGCDWCFVLYDVAHGTDISPWRLQLHREVEGRVLSLQAAINGVSPDPEWPTLSRKVIDDARAFINVLRHVLEYAEEHVESEKATGDSPGAED